MPLSPVREGTRVQLETILHDLSEGIITLGLDGTLHYANKAALAMHGAQRLTELGISASEYRDKFRLADLSGASLRRGSYPLERLLRQENFAELTVRMMTTESEGVHEYRGDVVRDSKGAPDFLVLFIRDKTEHYDAEQRFERTFTANPAPALINRLSDLRYIKVNMGFLEMTGYKQEEIIGRTAYEFDVLSGTTNRELAVARFHEGRTISPMESLVATREGGTKFVMVGGQPLDVGKEPCMLLTFIDLDDYKKAENALRQSEERFSKAFNLAPFASAILALDNCRILNFNEAFKRLTGYGFDETMGRTTQELGLWQEEDEKTILTALQTQHSYRDLELQLFTKAGEVRDVVASAETVVINEISCVLFMFHDVTQWRRTENELIEAINSAMEDPTWFSRTVAQKLMTVHGTKASADATTKLFLLTKRERQVLELICEGDDNRRIAAALDISHNTVRNYLIALYKKLGVHSRGELIVWANRNGALG